MPGQACGSQIARNVEGICARQEQWESSIRELGSAEILLFERHLLRLDSGCRQSRFGGLVSNAFLQNYASCVDFANTAVLGYFLDDEMRGACELRSLKATWCCQAELAFSVEKPWRQRGIGTALMARALQVARRLPIERLYLTCHPLNRAMQRIADRFAAKITYEECECFADIAVRWEPVSPLLEGGGRSQCALERMMVLDL